MHGRRFLMGMRAIGLGLVLACWGWTAAADERPNLVVIMADDMGYSDIGCYGGEIETPNLNRLAAEGMRFSQFYNNAKCAPTRASLLTGRYAQQVGCHNDPVKMVNCLTFAEVLRPAGYSTYMAGKWHAEELPTERGFDRYYGLTDGCCNYWNPGEQRDGEPKPAEKNYPRKWSRDGEVMRPYTPEDKDFYTTDAFTDFAVDTLKAHDTAKPFLLYLAYTAPHYPLQAPEEVIAKYRGKYRIGWDTLREQRHARQLDMGLLNPAWALSPRDPNVAPWVSVTEASAWNLEGLRGRREENLPWEHARDADLWDLKMAVYAAMVDRMDQNIGRVLAQLEAMGAMDNTLILFLSDNGGCAETRNDTPDVPPGPVNSYRSVDPPWANAQNTPFRLYKRYLMEGGISTPLIAHWPGHIEAGAITHAAGHLIDVLPTLVEAAGATYPADAPANEGRSLLPVMTGASAGDDREIFWNFGSDAAMRQGKWKLVHGLREPWQLYDMQADRTELHDVAAAHPERVQAMTDAWENWARKVGVEVRKHD
ncbi:MAG: sulfatase-like hydrolase/transferase [Candidatus Hydrogenedens sp.]|nr:sulfatase-like hydrolase/transferase [Candidatus Hydrogenedens sp.]